MVVAFILCNVQVGKEKVVLQKLQALDGVSEAHILYGEYDIMMKVELKEIEGLEEFVIKKIRKFPEIEKTITWVSVE
ncbi:MAG: Lrp/AsnC family transcriptional regulator [Candidatus Methanofastidiosia archaeon]